MKPINLQAAVAKLDPRRKQLSERDPDRAYTTLSSVFRMAIGYSNAEPFAAEALEEAFALWEEQVDALPAAEEQLQWALLTVLADPDTDVIWTGKVTTRTGFTMMTSPLAMLRSVQKRWGAPATTDESVTLGWFATNLAAELRESAVASEERGDADGIETSIAVNAVAGRVASGAMRMGAERDVTDAKSKIALTREAVEWLSEESGNVSSANVSDVSDAETILASILDDLGESAADQAVAVQIAKANTPEPAAAKTNNSWMLWGVAALVAGGAAWAFSRKSR